MKCFLTLHFSFSSYIFVRIWHRWSSLFSIFLTPTTSIIIKIFTKEQTIINLVNLKFYSIKSLFLHDPFSFFLILLILLLTSVWHHHLTRGGRVIKAKMLHKCYWEGWIHPMLTFNQSSVKVKYLIFLF